MLRNRAAGSEDKMMMKHVTFGAGLAVSAALALAGVAFAQETAAPAATPPVVPEGGADAVVAVVNGTEITLGHMIVLRANLPAQYQTLPDDVLFNGILEQLIQQEALSKSVEGNISKRDLLAMENDRRGYLSGVALGSVVQGAITDARLQAAYDVRFADEADRKEYNAAHILVPTEDAAKGLKAEIDAGADFAELAKQHSTDGAAANGGDLGWFGAGMMVAPFQDAVFAMEVGSVSDPVQTQFGWHLIQLKETRIAAAPPLDEIRDQLASEIEQVVVEEHISEITKSATITRPGEAFDPALLRDQTLLNP
jgi:peptidyl-prolyl cis-trans isomerase C